MARIHANGIDIEYETFGESGAPALLLLFREAVAQTLGQVQFLCIDDKSALAFRVISVA